MVRPFKSGSVHRLLSNVQMSSEQFVCGPHRFCINQVSLSTKVQRACACAWREQPLARARQGSFSHHRRVIWNSEMTIGCCLKKTNETNFNNTSTDILLIYLKSEKSNTLVRSSRARFCVNTNFPSISVNLSQELVFISVF